MPRNKQPSQAALEMLLGKWQQILRLQDWVVTIRYAPSAEMGNAVANIMPHIETKCALIRHITLSDYISRGYQGDFDVEGDIIHELLHLHFAYLDRVEDLDTEYSTVLLEQAIDSIQTALSVTAKITGAA